MTQSQTQGARQWGAPSLQSIFYTGAFIPSSMEPKQRISSQWGSWGKALPWTLYNVQEAAMITTALSRVSPSPLTNLLGRCIQFFPNLVCRHNRESLLYVHFSACSCSSLLQCVEVWCSNALFYVSRLGYVICKRKTKKDVPRLVLKAESTDWFLQNMQLVNDAIQLCGAKSRQLGSWFCHSEI